MMELIHETIELEKAEPGNADSGDSLQKTVLRAVCIVLCSFLLTYATFSTLEHSQSNGPPAVTTTVDAPPSTQQPETVEFNGNDVYIGP